MKRKLEQMLCAAVVAAAASLAVAQDTTFVQGDMTYTVSASEEAPAQNPGNWTFGSSIIYLKDPFGGEHQEGFEVATQPNWPGGFQPCLPDGIFGGLATLCANSAHITGGWGFACSIRPHGGSRLYGNTGGVNVIEFAKPAEGRFGGYFGTNNPDSPNAMVRFYNAAGNLIHDTVILYANDCTWNWHGFRMNVPVAKIEIQGFRGSGGYVMMDDLEYTADSGGGCDPCDVNCDGAVDAFDIEPFIDILVNMTPGCSSCAADTNEDGTVDAFDIEPFIECLVGP